MSFAERHITCSLYGPGRVKSHGAECQHKDEWHVPVRAYSDEEIEAVRKDGARYALMLVDTYAAGLEGRDASGAQHVREAVKAVEMAFK